MRKVLSRIGLISVFFFSLLCAQEESSFEDTVLEIQKKVEIYKNLKKKHQKNRERHLRLAHRWQQSLELSLETRREYALAEGQLDKIRLLEKQIEKLEEEKRELEKKEKEMELYKK